MLDRFDRNKIVAFGLDISDLPVDGDSYPTTCGAEMFIGGERLMVRHNPLAPKPQNYTMRSNYYMTGEEISICCADKARTIVIGGCSNSCSFCPVPQEEYEILDQEYICAEVSNCLAAEDCNHISLTGGTPRTEDIQHYLETIKLVSSRFNHVPVDWFVWPFGFPKGWMDYAKDIQVLSINIEAWGEGRELTPQKQLVSHSEYLDMVHYCSNNFEVKCGFVVGCEPIDQTIDGIKKAAEAGGLPVLSPFIPMVANQKQFLNEASLKDLMAAVEGIKLGPTCEACKYNVLV